MGGLVQDRRTKELQHPADDLWVLDLSPAFPYKQKDAAEAVALVSAVRAFEEEPPEEPKGKKGKKPDKKKQKKDAKTEPKGEAPAKKGDAPPSTSRQPAVWSRLAKLGPRRFLLSTACWAIWGDEAKNKLPGVFTVLVLGGSQLDDADAAPGRLLEVPCERKDSPAGGFVDNLKWDKAAWRDCDVAPAGGDEGWAPRDAARERP